MKRNLASFGVGILFALGLGLAGMTQPQKIIGFLNLNAWDPTLLFVMIGAIAVHAIGYRLVMRRKSPLFDISFHVPQKKDIDGKLIGGAILFGIGWGLGGFCPGPALVSLGTGQLSILVFVLMMLAGMSFYRRTEKTFPRNQKQVQE